ncbi:MAG: hypothetical protein KDC46_12735 [Thermoleophilia bacterium]|nr:hypothetical protein [Thermoleophilia bacterium]
MTTISTRPTTTTQATTTAATDPAASDTSAEPAQGGGVPWGLVGIGGMMVAGWTALLAKNSHTMGIAAIATGGLLAAGSAAYLIGTKDAAGPDKVFRPVAAVAGGALGIGAIGVGIKLLAKAR